MNKTVNQQLPHWDQLIELTRSSVPATHPALAVFDLEGDAGRRRLQPVFRMVAKMLNLWMRNAIYHRLFRATWDELVELYAEQVVRSAAFEERAASLGSSAVMTCGAEAEGRAMRRRHHQLPCTRTTVRDRALLVATLCSRSDPILLAGDDDFLSLELVRMGFKDVTALDIDPTILADLHAEADALDLPLQVLQHDLSQSAPAAFVRDYKLLITDPICTPAGVRLFLEGTLRMVPAQAQPRILLCTHLASQLRSGLQALEALLSRRSLVIERFLPGFGVYPNPRRLMRLARAVFWILQKTCLRTAPIPLAATAPAYFVSDALVLRRESGQAEDVAPATPGQRLRAPGAA